MDLLASVPNMTKPISDAIEHVLGIYSIAQAHDIGRTQLLVHLVMESGCGGHEACGSGQNESGRWSSSEADNVHEVSTMCVATRSLVTEGGIVSSGTTWSTCDKPCHSTPASQHQPLHV